MRGQKPKTKLLRLSFESAVSNSSEGWLGWVVHVAAVTGCCICRHEKGEEVGSQKLETEHDNSVSGRMQLSGVVFGVVRLQRPCHGNLGG